MAITQFFGQVQNEAYGADAYSTNDYQPAGSELSETGDPLLLAVWIGVVIIAVAIIVSVIRSKKSKISLSDQR